MPNPAQPTNRREQAPKQPQKVEDIFNFQKKERERAPAREVQEQPLEKKETIRETEAERTAEKRTEDETSRRQYVPPASQTDIQKEQKSQELAAIENILSDHLDELFIEMTPDQQVAFKNKGEETAQKIEVLLQQTKVKAKEVLQLIKEWLKLIPGVNKFFLEQEAKIKTDRIFNLHDKKHNQT